MPTEEQLSRVIRQGDPLGGNFEMNYSRGGQRFLLEHGRHCLLDGLRPGQRFHVHGEQVQNIAGWKKRRSRKFDRNYINYNITRERKERKEKSIQGEDRSSDSFRSRFTCTLREQLLRAVRPWRIKGSGRSFRFWEQERAR